MSKINATTYEAASQTTPTTYTGSLKFVVESAVLALVGGLIGVGGGLGIAALLRTAVPGLPVHTPVEFVAIAMLVSALTGMIAGVAPARRASLLDPIEALRAE